MKYIAKKAAAMLVTLLVISILCITPGRRFLLRTERKRGRKEAGENG